MDESYYEKREQWLEENNYTEGDIMIDSFNREYVLYMNEDGVWEKVFINNALEMMEF